MLSMLLVQQLHKISEVYISGHQNLMWLDWHPYLRRMQSQFNSLQDCRSLILGRIVRGDSGKFAWATSTRGAGYFRSQPNEFSWTKLISKHTNFGEGRKALRIYKKMREEGVLPSPYTFIAALKACSTVADVESGKEIHAHVIESGNQTHIFVATTLLDMYVKCGSMVEARNVFLMMPHRDVVSWTAIIIGYAQREEGEIALKLYACMQHEGFTPDDRTFVAALKACSSLAVRQEDKQGGDGLIKMGCLEKGRAIHSQVAQSGLESNVFVATALVDMYAKCGSMVDARQVFENMMYRNVVSWNAMIMGYAQMDDGHSALQLYARMQREGFTPDDRTFVAALKACSSLAAQAERKEVDGELIKIKCLEKGRAIHLQVAKCGLESDIFVASTLVDMYAKCRSMVDAWQVFERMTHRSVVSWNTMIMGYAKMEMGELALQLYVHMQHEGFTPDDRTFVAALKACCSLAAQEAAKKVDGELIKIGCLEKGRAIHSEVAKSAFESDLFVANALLVMYMKCGSIADAHQVFEKMMYRNVMSWYAMIIGYAEMEKGDLALQLYARMQCEGFTPDDRTFVAALKACSSLAAQEEAKDVDGKALKIGCLVKGRAIHFQAAKSGLGSNIFVANTLVDMYVKCGSMEDAYMVFDRMLYRTVVSWNCMIMGYVQVERGELALQLYARMQHEGFTPDAYTFVAALKACGSLASLATGKEIHAEIRKVGLEGETFVATCLIDMYSKCGSMEDAQRLFDALPVRGVVSWSALIAGYSGQGDSERVFELFARMQQEGMQPVGITFVSILTVCSHAGLMDKGLKYFHSMCSDYGISPQSGHYSCMVDLLGRAGQLDEAIAMVKKMPLEPVILTWLTILGACQKWNSVEIARHTFECAVRLDRKCAAAYVLMTNMYVSAHMWEESAKIQEMRMNARAWEKPRQC